MKTVQKLALAAVAIIVSGGMMLTGCNGGSGSGSKSDSTSDNTILGAGSTFDNPLFSKMFSEYNKLNGLKVNYQSIGSGGGIQQLTSKTVDFGASDAPLRQAGFSTIFACGYHTSYGRRRSDQLQPA